MPNHAQSRVWLVKSVQSQFFMSNPAFLLRWNPLMCLLNHSNPNFQQVAKISFFSTKLVPELMLHHHFPIFFPIHNGIFPYETLPFWRIHSPKPQGSDYDHHQQRHQNQHCIQCHSDGLLHHLDDHHQDITVATVGMLRKDVKTGAHAGWGL